jgi:serine/threonine-protein kinase
MLSGRPPFQAPNFGQLMVKVITEPPPPLPSHTPSGEPVPEALAQLTLRCLAKEPADRPQHLSEVITVLLAEVAPEPVTRSEDQRPTQPLPVAGAALSSARRTWGAIAAGALALIGTGLALWPDAPARAVQPPVTLTVHSVPEGARVVRADTGEALGVTPMVKELPRASAPMGLRVELAGHATSEHQVRLEEPASLSVPLVAMEPRKSQAEARTPTPGSAHRKKAGTRDDIIDPFAR